jgi:hypothetical protein
VAVGVFVAVPVRINGVRLRVGVRGVDVLVMVGVNVASGATARAIKPAQ